MKPKVGVIIQARMGSSRLPGKSLMLIEGKSMIWHVIERLKKSKNLDKIILATTIDKNDDCLKKIAEEQKVEFSRGSVEDVLDRYYQAAKKHKLDVIVRITGDCPLVDPHIVDNAIKIFLKNDYDYVSNEGIPKATGFDVEILSFKSLEKSWEKSEWASEREHVTQYIRKYAKKPYYIKNDPKFGKLHCSVDRIEDLEFVRAIYKHMLKNGKDHDFTCNDVLDVLEKHPEIKEINKDSVVDEGLHKSLREDKKIL